MQTRNARLAAMLDERRREILHDVQARLRGVRADGAARPHESQDPGETADADGHGDIEFVLIQMKTEALKTIGEALARLADGRYGRCKECGEGIAEARLRALPFAVRCRACETQWEAVGDRPQAPRRRDDTGLADTRR